MLLDATAGDEETHPVVALVEGTSDLLPTGSKPERPRGASRRAELAALAGIGQVVEG